MANYGTQTVGATGFQSIEVAIQGLLITLPGGETITNTQAYLQSTNGNTCKVKCVLYNSSTLALVHQSDQISFTDDVGGWKTITWPGTITPSAGSYYLTIAAVFLSGGLNDTRIAYDTVAASANYRRQSNGASGDPLTFADPYAPDNATETVNPSLYLVTAAAGGGLSVVTGTPRQNTLLRM